MLKRLYIKKMMLCGIVIFAILLVYIIPSNEEKLKMYQTRINDIEDINFYNNQMSTYLSNTLNINKG